MKKRLSLLALSSILTLAIQNAPAQVVVSYTGPSDPYIAIWSGQAFGVSWSQTIPYENVAVSVDLTAWGLTTETGRAFLSTTIGTGASQADQVAYTTFTFPSSESYVSLFSGLNLSAGNYYLSLVGDSDSYASAWLGPNGPTIVTGPGVTLGSSYGFVSPGVSYLPSSAVYNGGMITNFSVTGTAVPEPATYGILAGLSTLMFVSFRKRVGKKNLSGSCVQL